MKARLNPYRAAPEAMKALAAVQDYVQQSGLEPSLVDLVRTRASQINGCAYCIHLHTRDARAARARSGSICSMPGATRRRAALAWTEALTLVAETHVPDQVFEEVRQHFAEDELVKLTLVVAMINAWNRVAISFRSVHPVKPATAAK
jgi:AhpD family alkylhydroperoxidase